MTKYEIEDALRLIRESAGDNEHAHVLEDSLFRDFIEYVSTLDIPIANKAKLVLSSRDIEFERWCA